MAGKGVGGMNQKSMDFAFIGHPFDMDHLYRYLKAYKPDLKKPGRELLLKLFEWTPPFKDRDITITTENGKTITGSLIICPLLPEMVQNTGHRDFRNLCIEKVIAALKLAAQQGACIAGLGGFTSIADGDQGRLVAQKVPELAVTSGNTLTAMSAVDSVIEAAGLLGVDLAGATVAVVGATGDIGTACCRYLVGRVKRLVLCSRLALNQHKIAGELQKAGHARIQVENDNARAVSDADLVIAAASSVAPIFHQEEFKPGAIVCDVGYPNNIFMDTDVEKLNIFLFSGGLMKAPSPVHLPYDMGLPEPGMLYGCWSEAIALGMAGKYESFSSGRGNIQPGKMETIWEIAKQQGFERAPFFYNTKLWQQRDIERVRALAASKEIVMETGD